MASVTQRIKQITQPYGGYLPIKSFEKIAFDDGLTLNENENIHAGIIGSAVDYLTRLSLGDSVDKAFHISTLGAESIGMSNKAALLKLRITGLDDISISCACKLAGFDVCFRSSKSAYQPIETIIADKPTIDNIRIMVNRSITFWKEYGPVVCSEPTFQGGYTSVVDAGDGDFLSADTLWDFKVSKTTPTSKHSLQILMYYIMGLHSIHSHYQNITKLGIFNPRLNVAYTIPVADISPEVIQAVETDVICYTNPGSYQSEKTSSCPAEKKYTVTEISEITGLKKSLIYEDIRDGTLNASKIGNKYYVNEESFYQYLKLFEPRQNIDKNFAALFIIPYLLLLLWVFFRMR